MRRSIIECWSIRSIFWQWYSSSHNSQYYERFYRLLTDSQNQLFDLVENDLNRCKHECRFRYRAFNNWLICMRLVFSQMSLQMRHLASFHLRRKISFSTIRRSNHFRFRWFFLGIDILTSIRLDWHHAPVTLTPASQIRKEFSVE
jgi:hypothetical protein